MTTTLVKKSRLEIVSLTFDALVTRIRETLVAGRARAVEAVDRERSRTYWETGRLIHVYHLKGKDRAKYGEKILPRLAEKTGLSETLLGEIHLFYRSFPISPAQGKLDLPWADWQRLLRIKEPEKRLALAREAARKNWTSREVEAAVREVQSKALPPPANKGHARGKNGEKLAPKKGKFFTYQIVRPQNMHKGPGGYSLDLGFRIRHEIDFKGIRKPKPGEIVRVVRTKEDPAGDRYKVARGKNLKRSDLYTYKAKAQIYYDADTFWADVDFGFHIWGEQKLRLRGIDSRELGAGGERAASYVKKVLSPVPFIVITISGRDKFGRPLADVFYLPGADDREKVLQGGRFLNQELLDLGFARRRTS